MRRSSLSRCSLDTLDLRATKVVEHPARRSPGRCAEGKACRRVFLATTRRQEPAAVMRDAKPVFGHHRLPRMPPAPKLSSHVSN
ncbi:hypothetical protein SPRG_16616, partial [Saprolegnia parasitica CBS 223.65]